MQRDKSQDVSLTSALPQVYYESLRQKKMPYNFQGTRGYDQDSEYDVLRQARCQGGPFLIASYGAVLHWCPHMAQSVHFPSV
jgi:hypothetical protein